MYSNHENGVTVPLAHILEHDESHYDSGFSSETKYHRGSAHIMPGFEAPGGWIWTSAHCSVCRTPVTFDVEQQNMLRIAPKDAITVGMELERAFWPGLSYWLLGPGLMSVGVLAALVFAFVLYRTPPLAS